MNNIQTDKKTVIGDFTIKFGKHKGVAFKDIPLDYVKWSLEQGLFSNHEYKYNKLIENYLNARVAVNA